MPMRAVIGTFLTAIALALLLSFKTPAAVGVSAPAPVNGPAGTPAAGGVPAVGGTPVPKGSYTG
ncbi:MAG TPA: hypothetical protein VJ258_04840, partial [Candidatus Limnocylindrales bacterium]|nr:hypothetical protein [Candidatus Limnocylindrales bacterium]